MQDGGGAAGGGGGEGPTNSGAPTKMLYVKQMHTHTKITLMPPYETESPPPPSHIATNPSYATDAR